jgi:hypothetical protein
MDPFEEFIKKVKDAKKEIKDPNIKKYMFQDLNDSLYMALVAQKEKLTRDTWYNKVMTNQKDALSISKKVKNKNKEAKHED